MSVYRVLKPPSSRPIQGVITHTSDPKIITAFTTALKNIPNTLGFTLYFPKILNNRAQILLVFPSFPTISVQ